MHRILMFYLLIAIAAGCESTGQSSKAVLAEDSDASRDLIRTALSDDLGRGRIEFGAGDFSEQSQLTILPPPVVDPVSASPAMPELYDIVLIDDVCTLVRVSSGERVAVPGLRCRPVSPSREAEAP